MTLAQHATPTAAIPRIELAPDGSARVVRWGMVLGHILRPGDRIVPGPTDSPVVILVPRGRGRPMLACRPGRRLLALPGLVPASPERWRVAFGVQAIERDLERGAPGGERLQVLTRVEPAGPSPRPLDLPQGLLDTREIDALCIRAALAPRQAGVVVAVAAAPTVEQARQLLAGTPTGTLRFLLGGGEPAQAAGQVIAGPWPGSLPHAGAGPGDVQVPLPFGADTRRTA